ncbi:adaptor protein [Weissella coleopterorum]|uniref:Adapter protein MecA n=2 Tax=Weissella coleopterorum TaxID=2714949 RepID=A0A6G8B0Y6_9LACO|nr:adaptor protein [Weissella coleopterorum]
MMEMERINDDTIRVLVTKEDLDERSISLVDLLSNQDEVEKFFYSILAEVDVEHDFEQNEAVSFQVMPSQKGLEIFITKNMSEDQVPKEILDKLMGPEKGSETQTQDEVSDSTLHELLETDQNDSPSTIDKAAGDRKEQANHSPKVPQSLTFKFHDFEELIQLSQVLEIEAANKLVKYAGDYYLELLFDETYQLDEIKDITAIVREFGQLSPVATAVLAEHGQLIFETRALSQIVGFFK